MKNKDIEKLTETELRRKIITLKKDLFNFRFRKVNGQIDDTSKVSLVKKDIAKINTKLNKTKKNEQKNIKR